MTFYGAIFYLLAAITVAATALAVTRRVVVHAIVYLTVSFFALAPLFYLLGAPFLALLEVIIYAGAIMVLFLFTVMMLRPEPAAPSRGAFIRQWLPAMFLTAVILAVSVLLFFTAPPWQAPLRPALATPRQFGAFLFQKYWLAVEIASFLLFMALVGALYLGWPGSRKAPGEEGSS